MTARLNCFINLKKFEIQTTGKVSANQAMERDKHPELENGNTMQKILSMAIIMSMHVSVFVFVSVSVLVYVIVSWLCLFLHLCLALCVWSLCLYLFYATCVSNVLFVSKCLHASKRDL